MKDLGPDPQYSPPVLRGEVAAELAKAHGMHRVGSRPTLVAYAREIWRYRHLSWHLARGEFVAQHQDTYLGLLWAIINPLLVAAAYYFIFGLLLGTRDSAENFIAFLTIGLFVFTPIAGVLTSGSRALVSRLGMIRSLAFPRILLPVTVTGAHLLAAMPAFMVLLLIALATGERPSPTWLLYPVALLIVAMMSLGLALVGSRIVHSLRDAANLLPLLTRLLRYLSGIFFSVQESVARLPDRFSFFGPLLEYQPIAVALTMVRESLMGEYELRWETWAASLGWAVIFFVGGFLVFWRGEGTYGRP